MTGCGCSCNGAHQLGCLMTLLVILAVMSVRRVSQDLQPECSKQHQDWLEEGSTKAEANFIPQTGPISCGIKPLGYLNNERQIGGLCHVSIYAICAFSTRVVSFVPQSSIVSCVVSKQILSVICHDRSVEI